MRSPEQTIADHVDMLRTIVQKSRAAVDEVSIAILRVQLEHGFSRIANELDLMARSCARVLEHEKGGADGAR